MKRTHRLAYFAAWAVAALIVVVPAGYSALYPPPTRYDADADHFAFASVGVEAAQGVPYEVWRTLPGLCMKPEARATGYRAFGFQWAPGRSTPIGMPLETAIVPRVGINCALCHVGRVEGADGKSHLLQGAPNTSFDLQSYLRFLTNCVSSPAYNAKAVLAENDRLGGNLNFAQKLFYRAVIIPQVKTALLEQARELSFMAGQPDWGPGRAPGFQPAKIQVLGRPFDGTLDIVDIPPLWAMRDRDGGGLHWDGVNTDLHEVVLNSGIGNGATAGSIDTASLARTEAWVRDLAPPRYPWPIDKALAADGKAVFAGSCAECHAHGGAKTGQVIPTRMIGTDRNRLDALTPETAAGFTALDGYPWRYTHFRKTNGYVATPLDGLWARAPYLHNGSVPTLAALLTPPEARPVWFRRGSARYDTVEVGFASDTGRPFDTRLPGNSATGHRWGTDLPDSDRKALIEYLKTL